MKSNKQNDKKNYQKRNNKDVNEFVSSTDIDGSYTGINAEDIYEQPVQDVDDL